MPEFALFANFENPFGNTVRALHESVETIVHAERLGFDQVWLTEHHFNAFSVSASILPLLAHLAGRTSRIALGAGAVLLPFHDPVRVAEDVATIDALSGGRFLLGVGRGGPFPDQFRHFGVDAEGSRERLFEALEVVEKILAGTAVSHHGRHYHYDDLSVFPRPAHGRPPVWLAGLHAQDLALAAQRGYGLMGASATPVARLQAALADFRALQPAAHPPLVVARYFLCHEHDAVARAEALPFIRDFSANMRAVIRRYPESPAMQPFGQAEAVFAEAQLLDNAIVGSPAQCRERCQALREALGPHVLLLKPASYDPEHNRRSLSLFAEQVRPHL